MLDLLCNWGRRDEDGGLGERLDGGGDVRQFGVMVVDVVGNVLDRAGELCSVVPGRTKVEYIRFDSLGAAPIGSRIPAGIGGVVAAALSTSAAVPATLLLWLGLRFLVIIVSHH